MNKENYNISFSSMSFELFLYSMQYLIYILTVTCPEKYISSVVSVIITSAELLFFSNLRLEKNLLFSINYSVEGGHYLFLWLKRPLFVHFEGSTSFLLVF